MLRGALDGRIFSVAVRIELIGGGIPATAAGDESTLLFELIILAKENKNYLKIYKNIFKKMRITGRFELAPLGFQTQRSTD